MANNTLTPRTRPERAVCGQEDARLAGWLAAARGWTSRAGMLSQAGHQRAADAALATATKYRAMVASPPAAGPRKRRVTLRTRFLVMQRDGYRCQLCGQPADDSRTLRVDHRVAFAAGGSCDPSNLWTLCQDCNAGKSDLPL